MLRSSEAFWCNAAAEAFADHGDWISYRWARSIVLVGGLPRVFVCVWQLPDPARHFQVPHSCQMYVCGRFQDGWRRKSAMDPSMLTGARRHGEILQKLCKLCHGLSYCTWIRFFASWMHAHVSTHDDSLGPCSPRFGLRLEKCCEAGLLGWDIARMVTWNGWLDVEVCGRPLAMIGCCQNVIGFLISTSYSSCTWVSTYNMLTGFARPAMRRGSSHLHMQEGTHTDRIARHLIHITPQLS